MTGHKSLTIKQKMVKLFLFRIGCRRHMTFCNIGGFNLCTFGQVDD